MKDILKKWFEYWHHNTKSLKEGFDFIIILLSVVAFIIWLVCWYNGTDTLSDKWIKDISLILAIALFLVGVTWLPVKRHQEVQSEHQKSLSDLRDEHAKHAEILQSEIKTLNDEKETNAQVFVTASMWINPELTGQKVIVVKVINNTNKVKRVESVGVYLAPHVVLTNGVPALRSDILVPLNPIESVAIESYGDSAYWRIAMQPDIASFQEGNRAHGMGHVVFKDSSQINFEFEFI